MILGTKQLEVSLTARGPSSYTEPPGPYQLPTTYYPPTQRAPYSNHNDHVDNNIYRKPNLLPTHNRLEQIRMANMINTMHVIKYQQQQPSYHTLIRML